MIINNPTPPTQDAAIVSVPAPLNVEGVDNADAKAALGSILASASRLTVFNGATWDLVRTPSVFKNALWAPVGGTSFTIWTPAAGKKFRLMGYEFCAPPNIQGTTSISAQFYFTDGIYNIGIKKVVYVPGTFTPQIGEQKASAQLGNGLLSSAADNVLAINSTSGWSAVNSLVYVNVWGTEE